MALNKYSNEQLEQELKARKTTKKYTFTKEDFTKFFNKHLAVKKQEWQEEVNKTNMLKKKEAEVLSSAIGKTVEATETVTAEDFTNILKG